MMLEQVLWSYTAYQGNVNGSRRRRGSGAETNRTR